jgi:DNA-binding beta-propeller fold protein YncE
MTRIGSGYLTRTDPAALVVGPTGLAYDAKRNILYVASTGDNEIFAISNAGSRTSDGGTGKLVYQDDAHLRGPLGLVLAPNGDLITANGDAVNPDPTQTSELVEFTPKGKFVGEFSIDPNGGGAFGVAVSTDGNLLRFAAVEDVTNSLDIWTFDTNSKGSQGGNQNASGEDSASGANLVTAIGMPSDSGSATSSDGSDLRSPSKGSSSQSGSIADTTAQAFSASGRHAVVGQLWSDTHVSDVASTLFSHRRLRWGQS